MTETLSTVLDTIMEVIRMLKAFFEEFTAELGIEFKKDEAAE